MSWGQQLPAPLEQSSIWPTVGKKRVITVGIALSATHGSHLLKQLRPYMNVGMNGLELLKHLILCIQKRAGTANEDLAR
jgi:hypothetical protein